MNGNQPPAQTTEPIGLAIASLVLGIISIPFSIFLIGALTGLVGLGLGLIHALQRVTYRKMAWWGVALSVVGILFSVKIGLTYRRAVREWQTKAAARWEDWRGVRAPDWTLTTLDGSVLRLSELRGKRIVLDFWATWCPPCVKEIPHFIALANDPEAKDVLIIGISSEEESTLREFASKHGVNYPIVRAQDKDLPSPFDAVQAIPTTFFIDRNGVIQTIFEGYRDYATLRQAALATDYEGVIKDAPTVSAPAGQTAK